MDHGTRCLLLGGALLLGLAGRVAAQAGAATDLIAGRVTDAGNGTPVEYVTVTATSRANGLVRTTRTGADGRYLIVFAEGGGRYVLRVRRLGYAPVTVALERRPEADRITADVSLIARSPTLDTVTVTAYIGDSAALGSNTGRTLSQVRVDRLPLDAAGDIGAIAALAPGVIGFAGTDTSAASFSVGGQRPTQNHVSLDGLSFAAGAVPRDAIRETRVVTSTYDVAKGQFSGGEVASSTRSGTNTLLGSLTYDLQSRGLQAGAAPSAPFSREYQLDRMSASVGGPLRHDAIFGFLAVEGSARSNPIANLLVSDPVTDSRLGIDPDTVKRFLSLAGATGLPLNPSDIPTSQTQYRGSALGRLDVVLGEANHLVVRADWHGNRYQGTRGNPRGLLQSLGRSSRGGGGLFAGLTTQSGSLTNDVRITWQADYRHEDGYLALPRGRVFISSATADGSVATFEGSVGGNQDFPTTGQSQLLEAGDEVAWLVGGGAHRLKVGALVNRGTARTDETEQKSGVFVYNSLADFAANQPASYTRVLSAGARNSSREGAAFYLGDAWQPRGGFELDFGLRLEGSRYGDVPARNAAVESTFGLRTDRFPSEVHVSPRFGFSYAARGDEDEPGLALRGGFGEFRGTVPDEFFSLSAQSTGLPSGQSLLTCTGAAVPTPDWAGYLANSANIPSTCAGGAVTLASGGLPSVAVFAPDLQAPRVWRASLGATWRLIGPITAAVDVYYIRGVSQLALPDLNLNTTAQFALANEANRPVYVPVSTIDTSTGAVSVDASRLHPAFGTVSLMQSSLHSSAVQATVSLSGEFESGASLEASYTYSNVRDQALGFDGESADGITGGNPNVPVWGRADEERRHQLETTMTIPVKRGIEVAVIGRLMSGFPFTPGVGQDINGDGQRNDAAFVFDPAATADTSIANGMKRLLASGTATARQCLPSQFGRPAARNSCTGPWVPGLDLRLSVTPSSLFGRRVTFSVTALNVLVGLDELLHGRDGLRGWGQDASSDRRLLFVTGFDPVAQTFRYRVNQHFGAASGSLNPFRIPFVLALQARIKLGGRARD